MSHHSEHDDEDQRAGSGDTEDKPGKKRGLPVAKGNAQVFVSMAVVSTMIAITTAIVLGFTFSFLSRDEQENFENGVSIHIIWSGYIC